MRPPQQQLRVPSRMCALEGAEQSASKVMIYVFYSIIYFPLTILGANAAHTFLCLSSPPGAHVCVQHRLSLLDSKSAHLGFGADKYVLFLGPKQ